MTEARMVIAFCEMLERDRRLFSVEIPFFSRSIDVVINESGSFHAIEFKLADWRGGIKQALRHSFGARYVSICLPFRDRRTLLNIQNEAHKNNCGLILFDVEKGRVIESTRCRPYQISPAGLKIFKKGWDYAINHENYKFLRSLV